MSGDTVKSGGDAEQIDRQTDRQIDRLIDRSIDRSLTTLRGRADRFMAAGRRHLSLVLFTPLRHTACFYQYFGLFLSPVSYGLVCAP